MNILNVIRSSKVFYEISNQKISPKLAYKILKIRKEIETEETFYREAKRKIIEEFAKRNDNGEIIISDDGFVIFDDEKMDEATKEFEELNRTEVDEPKEKIFLTELEEMKLSVSDMISLEPFIVEE